VRDLNRSRRFARAVLACALALAGVEATSLLFIHFTRPLLTEEIRTTRDIFREQSDQIRTLLAPDTTRLLVLDPVLGWRYRANHRDSVNETNADAARSARRYSRRPRRGVLRVAAFGNSFVYCNEVKNQDAWPQVLEDSFPNVEVVNYGVGGYGLDQAYLRFLAEGSRLSPAIVIIGFAPDDLGRLVNVYRRFRSNHEIPLVKPRYLLDGRGQLALLPNPVRGQSDYVRYLNAPSAVSELGKYDQWYEPAIYQDPPYDYSATVRLLAATWIALRQRYLAADRLVRDGVFNRSSTAFRIQMALFRRFADAVRAAGARPLVVLFPDREAVAFARQSRKTVLRSVVEALRAEGIDYVDLTEAFVSAGVEARPESWFMSGGHYSPVANRLVAIWLGKRLWPKFAK